MNRGQELGNKKSGKHGFRKHTHHERGHNNRQGETQTINIHRVIKKEESATKYSGNKSGITGKGRLHSTQCTKEKETAKIKQEMEEQNRSSTKPKEGTKCIKQQKRQITTED